MLNTTIRDNIIGMNRIDSGLIDPKAKVRFMIRDSSGDMKTYIAKGDIISECICNRCGSTGIKVCSGCKKVRYCSRECQKEDWSDHKQDCKHHKIEKLKQKRVQLMKQHYFDMNFEYEPFSDIVTGNYDCTLHQYCRRLLNEQDFRRSEYPETDDVILKSFIQEMIIDIMPVINVSMTMCEYMTIKRDINKLVTSLCRAN